MRKARGITQEQLSATSRLDQGWISKLERGTGNWTADTLQVLAAALGCEWYELLGYSIPPGPSADAQVILSLFCSLPPDLQRVAKQQIMALAAAGNERKQP